MENDNEFITAQLSKKQVFGFILHLHSWESILIQLFSLNYRGNSITKMLINNAICLLTIRIFVLALEIHKKQKPTVFAILTSSPHSFGSNF